jgi:hypothetical protein
VQLAWANVHRWQGVKPRQGVLLRALATATSLASGYRPANGYRLTTFVPFLALQRPKIFAQSTKAGKATH